MTTPLEPLYFENAAALRRWFSKNAGTETVLVVGFMKKDTGVASISWPESVDEALCVGWIDGVRNRIDGQRYKIRFTPRRSGSHWSNINIRRVGVLKAAGRMKAPGLKAFGARTKSRSGRAAYEQRTKAKLSPQDLKVFRQSTSAWKFYNALPPGYRQTITWWIISARKPETHDQRLRKLIGACAKGHRLT